VVLPLPPFPSAGLGIAEEVLIAARRATWEYRSRWRTKMSIAGVFEEAAQRVGACFKCSRKQILLYIDIVAVLTLATCDWSNPRNSNIIGKQMIGEFNAEPEEPFLGLLGGFGAVHSAGHFPLAI